MAVKDYLTSENERNKQHAEVYVRLLKRAFRGEGNSEQEMIGHHISFEFNGDIRTMNEIPSADTLLFDHDIMKRAFDDDYLWVMTKMAGMLPCERELWLSDYMGD